MTIRDWIDLEVFALGVLGIIVARFWPALPAKANEWLDLIGGKAAVVTLITEAAELCEKSPSVRRAFVKNEIQTLAETNGLTMPDSVANLIVEWVYQQVKGKLPT